MMRIQEWILCTLVLADTQFDIPLKLVGVIGSGDTTENCDVKYIELGLIEDK
jgi:hypothetical protein